MPEWGPSKRNGPKGPTKAEQRNEKVQRRLKVAELALARVPQFEIAKTLGVSTATVSLDLKALREEWRKEGRERIDQAQEHELAALAKDERRIRQRIARLKEEDTKGLCDYMKAIMSIMERRAKLLGTDAAIKVEAKNQTQVTSAPFTVDVAKIIADPEACERLLDAVQKPAQRLALEAVNVVPPPTNGNGANGHG